MNTPRATCLRLVLVACALTCAAPAAGAEVVGRDAGSVGPLAVDGDGALWVSEPEFVERFAEETIVHTALRAGFPGRDPLRLATVGYFSGLEPYYSFETVRSLSVSGGRAVYSTLEEDTAKAKYTGNGVVGARAYVLDLVTRKRTKVLGCGEFGGAESALSWPWLVTSGCTAAGERGGPVVVRNLSRPAEVPLRLAERGYGVRAAGSMVSWSNGADLIVYDLTADKEVLRIPDSMLPASAGTYDLQENGAVAAALYAPEDTPEGDTGYDRIAWASPASPKLTVVTPGGFFFGLRMVHDRFVFERDGERMELAARTLAGDEHVIARYDYGGGFAVNGTRVAWARAVCDRTDVVVGRADGATDDHRVDLCPLLIPRGRPRVTTRGRLSLRVRCQTLSPALRADECRVVASIRMRGQGLATVRRRVAAGKLVRLTFPPRSRLVRLRPGKISIRVRSTMRGGTRTSRANLRPTYPRRKNRQAATR